MILYLIFGILFAVVFDAYFIGIKKEKTTPHGYILLTILLWPLVIAFILFDILKIILDYVLSLVKKNRV